MEQRALAEYGGYLPLELPSIRREYYVSNDRQTVVDLDCGRSALRYALQVLEPDHVFIPRYYCPSVKKYLVDNGFATAYYDIGFDLLPVLDSFDVGANDVVVLVNYFGVISDLTSFAKEFPKVIIDNCLSFFSEPILGERIISIYSCRKFFGVSDGSYAIGVDLPEPDYPSDYSAYRALHLLLSLESGTNEGYRQSLENENALGKEPKRMSGLTHAILSSIDYSSVRAVRAANFQILHSRLSKIQQLNLLGLYDNAYCYPLLADKQLRLALVDKNVYVARFWEDWIGIDRADTPQYLFSNYMACLPLDQRYNCEDMERLANLVISVYEGV